MQIPGDSDGFVKLGHLRLSPIVPSGKRYQTRNRALSDPKSKYASLNEAG
jgi:hypothetical protein